MFYEQFYNVFPKIAAKKTRILYFFNDEYIPDGGYAFSPAYCSNKKCDCRRALVFVFPDTPEGFMEKPLAVISYGWEDFNFYRNWSNSISDEGLEEFMGPALDRGQHQSEYAPYLLEAFIDVIEKDTDYCQRLQRHYAYLKHKKGMRLPLKIKQLMQPLSPCPCESGKIFKLCCGKTRSKFSRGKRKR